MEITSLRVLAIDDDPADLKLFRRSLSQITRWETTLVEFFDWESARDEVNNQMVDLIFVDYLLGAKTGLDVVKEIREKDSAIPIIVLTGHGDETIATQIMRAGADDYLVKQSLDIDIVRRAISNALAQYQLRQEKAQLTEELLQSQKMETIGTLAGGIAHDFNNILAPIIGYAELSKSDLPENSPVQKHLDLILQSSYRARDLVKHLLTFSRQGEKKKVPMQISSIITEVLQFMRASLPVTIDIDHTITAHSDSILGDPTQMHQVLMNLVANAAHAMGDKGGLLEISLTKEQVDHSPSTAPSALKAGNYLKLRVSDSGHGIPQDILHKIFDPFFSTKERGQGTGLGLSVVQGIVTDHSGKITVKSSHEGTAFTILFPCLEETKQTSEAGARRSLLHGGNEYILITDDEEALVELYERILTQLGYKVKATTSSFKALDYFQNQAEDFDLVITDQTMPKMTGVEFANEIKQIRPDIPIILCTGFSDIITAANAKSFGIEKLIMKPLDKTKLAVNIREVLAKNSDASP